jgi:uncharacterized spore protein YtfJ
MRTQQLIDTAVEHLATSASVKTVYGEPVVRDGKTVIPVAKVAYGFGHGTRKEKADGAEPESGGGGGVAAKPIGVVEISGAETKFVPFGQVKKIALWTLVASAAGVMVGWLMGRRNT